MEPEGSLPHSQAPATCPYPQQDQASRAKVSVQVWRNVKCFVT